MVDGWGFLILVGRLGGGTDALTDWPVSQEAGQAGGRPLSETLLPTTTRGSSSHQWLSRPAGTNHVKQLLLPGFQPGGHWRLGTMLNSRSI